MNGQYMAEEIRQQPAVLERILLDGLGVIRDVALQISRRDPHFAMFVARGTSDHAAHYAKYLVETRLGWPAGLASPSTVTIYDAHPRMEGVLFVAVSQSGGSPDLLEPLQRARASGAVTVAVTNAPGSALAAAAEFHLDVRAGAERAVAATKSYTAELLTLFLLFDCLAGGDGGEARSLPELAHGVLALEPEVARLASRYRFAEQLVITARGYNYPTAQETALKLMETTYIVAHAFSGADLLHGPMAMIDRDFPVIAIAPGGPGSDALVPVLEQLQAVGADALVVGSRAAAGLGTVALELGDVGPEMLSPILTIVPLQHLAWYLARERGSDPDQPRGLSKVTRTR
jgi:glucosamine--fructose-6-phosphate aminotransferase (isomerizing)